MAFLPLKGLLLILGGGELLTFEGGVVMSWAEEGPALCWEGAEPPEAGIGSRGGLTALAKVLPPLMNPLGPNLRVPSTTLALP